MGTVAEALAEYRRVVDEAGFEYFGRMRPGRPKNEVVETLQEVGLEPSEDLVDWYSFHDGILPGSDSNDYVELFDYIGVCTFDKALEHHQIRLSGYLEWLGLDPQEIAEIREDGLEMPYEPTWFPISTGQETCIIDTDPTNSPSPLLALWDDEQTPRTKAESLTDWIHQLTTQATEGELAWQSPLQLAGVKAAVFPVGELTPTRDSLNELRKLPDSVAEWKTPHIFIWHPPVGTKINNKSLEERQAQIVRRILVDQVGVQVPVSLMEGPAQTAKSRFVVLDILFELAPAGTF